ncbi:MAG: hypothetical protein KKD44_04240 [Proteobacteria bacterium]|nr:hypothetical protein [Pseudomonadota bacterium]
MKTKPWGLALACGILVLTLSCAGKANDPLKNTRKLVKEGHASLYKNGAFRVPQSSIYLIPPGPDTLDLVMDMAGLRARQALLKSLKQASESVYIVSEGTKLSIRGAKASRETGHEMADFIKTNSRESSVWLLDRSWDKGGDLIGDSWVFSKQLQIDMAAAAHDMVQNTSRMGDHLNERGTENGKALIRDSRDFSREFYADRVDGAKDSLDNARTSFIQGYLAIPDQLKRNMNSAGENLDKADFSRIVEHEHLWRDNASGKTKDLVLSTATDYTHDVRDTFSKAGDELSGCYTTGIPLASLKALRWVLQGLFWDATIEPAMKMTAGGLGYIGVNCVAFPVMVIEEEGRAMARIAVDVAWNTTKSLYQLTAPSGEAALAGIYGLMEYTSGPVIAGAALGGGTLAGVTSVGASKAGCVIVKGSGHVAGSLGQYIGVPLAAAGVAATGTTVGLAVMGSGAAGSGTVLVGGETVAAGTDLFGNIIAGTTLVTGTTASVAGGSAYGLYQLSKAVMVPSGYEVGAGVVLSYEAMTHLGAQSILAVSDCAYLVLSLEGPRWVVYGIKGNLGKGDDLIPGTVLDLNAMNQAGEEIYNLPVSDSEMKQVVSSTYQNLPQLPVDPNESEE